MQGPLLVVANHPFGVVEGLALTSLLLSLRPDVRVLANRFLMCVSDVHDLLIPVDTLQRPERISSGASPLQKAMQWVAAGGSLIMFPAGEVSHCRPSDRHVTDPLWQRTAVTISRRIGCPVLPIYVAGRNGALFQAAGFVHPRLRTVLLPRELLRRRGTLLRLSVGALIAPSSLAALPDDETRVSFLRARTYSLQHRHRTPTSSALKWRSAARLLECVAEPVDPVEVRRELLRLIATQSLAENGSLLVFHASADQIPNALADIGRLREITFRAAGEGTGRQRDLDEFDFRYSHIVLVDTSDFSIVGAYRAGRADEIVRTKGPEGLYTSTLFQFQQGFFDAVGLAVELGRSFVRLENQRDGRALPLLWKGLNRFMALRSGYRRLMGPVSISNSYTEFSRCLIAEFLKATSMHPVLRESVRGLNPFNPSRTVAADAARAARSIRSLEQLSDWVSNVEPNGKGVPVLLKHYLKLGARVLALNVDPDFSNVLDALIALDLDATESRMLRRVTGKREDSLILQPRAIPAAALQSVVASAPAEPLI